MKLAILLLLAACTAPDVEEIDAELHGTPRFACRSICNAKFATGCPLYEAIERDTCYTICTYDSVAPECEDEYTNVQLCRLFSPAPVYTCRSDGKPYLTDPTRCQSQERALAACGEPVRW